MVAHTQSAAVLSILIDSKNHNTENTIAQLTDAQ